MPQRFLTGLLASILLCLGACNDPVDSIAPKIIFLSPSNNYALRVPDTVQVEADIRDDREIESVSVTLVDENYIPRVQGATFFPGTGTYLLSASIPVTDKRLAGGRYYFQVTATDGHNTEREYLAVSLQEVPRQVNGFLLVSGNTDGATTLTVLDESYVHDTLFALADGYTLGAAHGMWEYFIYATREPSVLKALTMKGFETMWEFTAEPPRPGFTGIDAGPELVFATANGDAGILNEAGNVILRTAVQPQQTIACLAADEHYLYAEITDLSLSVREITVFYKVSGAVKYAKRHNDAIIGIVPVNGMALLVSNEAYHGRLSLLDPENLEITYSGEVSGQPYHFALKTKGETFLLFTPVEILSYDLSADMLGSYLQGYYTSGSFDDLNGLLYLAADSRVEVRDQAQGTLLHTLDIQEPVMDFHVVFNK